MSWKVIAASVQGKSHIDLGLPCQDAHAFKVSGSRLIGVVCDGAGSAKQSQRGAELCVRSVVENLSSTIVEADMALAAKAIMDSVGAARDVLVALAASEQIPLDDLNCTLVGVIADPEGGILFHIGDGIGVVETESSPSVRHVSMPENGEYANETYFITADLWRQHLRLTEFSGKAKCVALMSDGAMPFVMTRTLDDFSRPFIDPVTRYLLGTDDVTGTDALKATLASEGTWAITGDDKTLLLAYPVSA